MIHARQSIKMTHNASRFFKFSIKKNSKNAAEFVEDVEKKLIAVFSRTPKKVLSENLRNFKERG